MNSTEISGGRFKSEPLDVAMKSVERTPPPAALVKVEAGETKPVWIVHVEVRVKPESTAPPTVIREHVLLYLQSGYTTTLLLPSSVMYWDSQSLLKSDVESILVTETTCPMTSIAIEQAQFEIHVYQPDDSDIFEEFAAGDKSEGGEDVVAASVCELPCRRWDGLWDQLIYADDIKRRLLDYIYATLIFSDRDVDFNIISWNRVAFLHGPPGTGKTSLCRALAQKLAIRMSGRYPVFKLVEINSHSLFSRWFSESGKLVQRLFTSVTDMLDDEETFVVLLIDEVESLTAARAGAMAGNEPTDALRVVNALLTQLDKLKHRKNILVVTTSNLAEAIDTAFIDRADIVQYVGLPPQEAIYRILQSCINELVRAKIIGPVSLLDPSIFSQVLNGSNLLSDQGYNERASQQLWDLAGLCKGMSGRSLRRLPVLAHARHIGAATIGQGTQVSDVEVWLTAMGKVVGNETKGRSFVKDSTI